MTGNGNSAHALIRITMNSSPLAIIYMTRPYTPLMPLSIILPSITVYESNMKTMVRVLTVRERTEG